MTVNFALSLSEPLFYAPSWSLSHFLALSLISHPYQSCQSIRSWHEAANWRRYSSSGPLAGQRLCQVSVSDKYLRDLPSTWRLVLCVLWVQARQYALKESLERPCQLDSWCSEASKPCLGETMQIRLSQACLVPPSSTLYKDVRKSLRTIDCYRTIKKVVENIG